MLRKYKVHFVDFGNMYTVTSEDIWPVEKRFSDFPIMAYLCGFDGIVSNFDHLYIIDRMDKYLPQGVTLQCEYIEKNTQNDLYFVNVNVNKVSLKETLKTEGLITEICPGKRMEMMFLIYIGRQFKLFNPLSFYRTSFGSVGWSTNTCQNIFY